MKQRSEDPRPVEIKKAFTNSSVSSGGHFHGWCKEPFYEGGNYFPKTFALVELLDGNVKLIEPEFIKFKHPLTL